MELLKKANYAEDKEGNYINYIYTYYNMHK